MENAFVAPMNDSGSEVVGKAVGSRCVNVRGRVWVIYAGRRQPGWRPPQIPEAAVHFSLGLRLGRMTPISILFCTGGNVIAAVTGLSCTLSAA